MLTQIDIKRIGQELGKVIEQNITPALDLFRTKLHTRMDRLEVKMVTKDYLDDKLADMRGDYTVKFKKLDNKVDELVDVLGKKTILTLKDKKRIKKYKIFS